MNVNVTKLLFQVFLATTCICLVRAGENDDIEILGSNCSTCGCPEIVISSDGIINEASEYHDTNIYDLTSINSSTYQFWENVTYFEEIEKDNKLKLETPGGKLREKLLSVDIHSDKYSSLWKKYNGTFNQDRSLRYKDLLGTYNLDSCYEDYLKKLSPVYKKVLPDGTEAFLYKKKLGATWHVGPYVHATFDRTYEWGKVLEAKRSSNITSKTQSHLTFKSDAWLYALCTGDCPTNCTGYGGESTDWGFVKKSINPIRLDAKIPDPSLNVMCKDDYLESKKNEIPTCTTDESGKDKNQACQFPFKFRGALQRGCIKRGSKKGKFWCPTAVGKRRNQLKGKWGNCDPNTCDPLDFKIKKRCPEGFVKYRRRCYGFFVHQYDRTTWKKAQSKCRSFNGGDLVSIMNDAESRFIAKKVLSINPELKEKEFYNPWIGLYIRKKSNDTDAIFDTCPRCAWSDKNRYSEHSVNLWAPNEPSHNERENQRENCVHIYSDGLWNNVNCDEPRGYICAGPPPSEGNFCKPNPCQNGGRCDSNIQGTGFECVCSGPYRGRRCQNPINHDVSDCLTTGGGQVGKPCVFPFEYKGKKYSNCAWEIGEAKPWCSTKVEPTGKHVTGGNHWGYCNAYCPATEDPR